MSDRVIKVRMSAQVSDYEAGMLAAAKATQKMGSEAEKLAQKRQAFEQVGQGLVVTGAALTAVTALSIKAAMGWESAWAGVTKTVDGTDEELARVEDGLRSLTGVLPASHDEIAAVAEAAGQLGIETENVVGFTRTMIDLGETTNLSANDAATALARFTNIMGTSQSEVDNLGSALVGLGNNYATTESEILEMSMRLAGAGKQIGLSEGDVLGLATALSSVGIEAEAGGSAMSKVMIDIASSVEEGGARLDQFAEVAGVSADQFANQWRTAPSEALSMFVKGLANAESQGKSTLGILSELDITEVRMRDALLRSASAADQFSTAMADGNQAFDENNALTLEAAKRYETVESKIAIAGNAVRDAAIDFGEVFLPAVGGAAEAVGEFAGFMGDLPDPVQGVMGVLGGVTGAIALTGGAIALAIPKFAEFKVALQTLNTSFSKVAWVGGGAVAALTAVVAIVGAVSAAQAEARERAEAYADTLAEGTNKITKATREMAAANLAQRDQILWWENPSAFDAAEALGVSLDLMTEAALGDADAIRELDAELQRLKPDAFHDSAEMEAYENRVSNITREVQGNADSLEEAARMNEQQARATEKASDAARTAAEVYEDETSAVRDLSGQLTKLIDTINEANGVGQDAVSTNARYQSALAGISEEVDKQREAYEEANGSLDGFAVSLDRNTEAGSGNAAMLADVASAAQDAAKAQFEQDKATMSSKDAADKYYETLSNQRQAFIDSAEAAGFNRDEVIKLADEVFALPSEQEIQIIADTDNAEDRLRILKQSLDGIPNVKRVTLEGYTVGNFDVSPNENGGLHTYAFANGGIASGIYPGGAEIHKFAEKSLPWEAYISPKADQRERNRGVWMETGSRLGFLNPAPAAAEPAQFNVTVSSKGGVDLLEYVDVRIDEKTDELGSGLRGF